MWSASGEQFLESVNRSYYLERKDGQRWEVRRRGHEDGPAQLVLCIAGHRSLQWAKRIDIVVTGPCPGELGDVSEAFPMGRYSEQNQYRSWLHHSVAGAKRVLVIAECCNGYSSTYEELLRRAIPEVEWVFSESFPDLCKNGLRSLAIQALFRDGILAVAEKS